MKNVLMLLPLLVAGASVIAQGVFLNQTTSTIEKVVQDYPSQFKNIRGVAVSSTAGISEYQSTIVIPGSISSSIIQSVAAHKQSISWQSIIYASTNFDEAKAHFEECFNQLKNAILKTEDGKSLIVNGLYAHPTESKNLNSIQFDLLPATGPMQKLNIALLMKKTNQQWKVLLMVYDNDRREMASIAAN